MSAFHQNVNIHVRLTGSLCRHVILQLAFQIIITRRTLPRELRSHPGISHNNIRPLLRRCWRRFNNFDAILLARAHDTRDPLGLSRCNVREVCRKSGLCAADEEHVREGGDMQAMEGRWAIRRPRIGEAGAIASREREIRATLVARADFETR